MKQFIHKWFVILRTMVHTVFLTLGLGILCLSTALLHLENPVHLWRELVQLVGAECFYSLREWGKLFKC